MSYRNSKWVNRNQVIEYIYADLSKTEESTEEEILKDLEENYNFNQQTIDIILYYSKHKKEIKNQVQPLLKENWFFKRLPVIDRTIFFAIISEYTLIKTKKAILISEAMKIANSYAEFKTISYINPILEKILN
ncbi:MAG: hypothetical protein LBH55_03635 [Mycoplasmataceae bacterium]|nr:hypothetical protein [Mycoplasmataceae bacterium]